MNKLSVLPFRKRKFIYSPTHNQVESKTISKTRYFHTRFYEYQELWGKMMKIG